MALRQWFLIKDVEGSASNPVVRKSLDHCPLVDRRSSADVDHDCAVLHCGEFGISDQTSSLLGQWDCYDYIVALWKHFQELLALIDFIDQRIFGRPLGDTRESEHIHSQCTGPDSHRSSDASVSHDAQCLARDHCYLKWFPHPSHLVVNHAVEILGEVQNRG